MHNVWFEVKCEANRGFEFPLRGGLFQHVSFQYWNGHTCAYNILMCISVDMFIIHIDKVVSRELYILNKITSDVLIVQHTDPNCDYLQLIGNLPISPAA